MLMISRDYRLQLIKSKFLFRDCAQVTLVLFSTFMEASQVFISIGVIACIIGFVISLIFGKQLNQPWVTFPLIIITLTTIGVSITANIPCFQAQTSNLAHYCICPDIKGSNPSFYNLIGHPIASATFQIKNWYSLHLAQMLQICLQFHQRIATEAHQSLRYLIFLVPIPSARFIRL